MWHLRPVIIQFRTTERNR